jgi:hypothetical protein
VKNQLITIMGIAGIGVVKQATMAEGSQNFNYVDVSNVHPNQIRFQSFNEAIDSIFQKQVQINPFRCNRKKTLKYWEIHLPVNSIFTNTDPSSIKMIRNMLEKCSGFRFVMKYDVDNPQRISDIFLDNDFKNEYLWKYGEDKLWMWSHTNKDVPNVGVLEFLDSKKWQDQSNYLWTAWSSKDKEWELHKEDGFNNYLLVQVMEDGSKDYICKFTDIHNVGQARTKAKILASFWKCFQGS